MCVTKKNIMDKPRRDATEQDDAIVALASKIVQSNRESWLWRFAYNTAWLKSTKKRRLNNWGKAFYETLSLIDEMKELCKQEPK